MSAVLAGFKPSRFRLPHKVGGPSLPKRPRRTPIPLSPGEKRRRLDAAYLERFFAREQRRLATGLLAPPEREVVRLPTKGRVRPAIAQYLGLVPNPNASPDDPEATYWIPAAPYGRIAHSPFLPNPRARNVHWPELQKPLLSPLKFRRLYFAAKRQGLEHLLPLGPRVLLDRFESEEQRRKEAFSDSDLLDLAARLPESDPFRQSSASASPEVLDNVMRTFALTTPKYRDRPNKESLFPYARMRLLTKKRRAQEIVDAMAKMPQKVQAYRESVHKSRIAARRGSPL